MKNTKIANINIKLKDLFFKWVEITRPFHKLSNQQQHVLALFLYYHYQFKKEITNKKVIWKLVFDYDTKVAIKKELNLKDAGFQNIMYQLRKRHIIKDEKINSAYIPDLSTYAKNFKIIFNFNIVNGKK